MIPRLRNPHDNGKLVQWKSMKYSRGSIQLYIWRGFIRKVYRLWFFPLINDLKLAVGPGDMLPIHIDISIGILVVQVLFMLSYCLDYMQSVSMSYIEETVLVGFPFLCLFWSYALFCDAFWSLRSCRTCIVKLSTGVRHPNVRCSLNFYELWLSVIISISFKKEFF